MQTDEQIAESQALAANDIRVLVGQLNEAIKHGAGCGLTIVVDSANVIDVKGIATHYPALTVRVLSELR